MYIVHIIRLKIYISTLNFFYSNLKPDISIQNCNLDSQN